MKRRKKSEPMRASTEFKRLLKEIRDERFRRKLDKEPKTYPRLTLAISRIDNLKDILMNAELKEDNKK